MLWNSLPRLVKKVSEKAHEKFADQVADKIAGRMVTDGRMPERISSCPPGIRVVPKGLRSYDGEDKSYFIHLLPGPYREGGLPESIHFWKTRIETDDPDKTFRVGVIYGPSGCGKSSLVKAGLIPHRPERVIGIYWKRRARVSRPTCWRHCEEEMSILSPKGRSRQFLRRTDKIPAGMKVLIVLDQFEQYLHSTPEDQQESLTDALKECDGERIQCLLMVRDNFITPVTRFINGLGIQLSQNHNYALVDLFDKRHARKGLGVLRAGVRQAVEIRQALTSEQDSFLTKPSPSWRTETT